MKGNQIVKLWKKRDSGSLIGTSPAFELVWTGFVNSVRDRLAQELSAAKLTRGSSAPA